MKQFIYFSVVCVVVMAMVACVSNQETSKSDSSSVEDSTAVVDTTAMIDTVAVEPVANAQVPSVVEKAVSSADITFKTFTHKTSEGVHSSWDRSRVVKNLKKAGFTLAKKKAERRLDYTGEDYYNTVVETYTYTANGQTTTVLLEDDYTVITFPNSDDALQFYATIKAAGLRKRGNILEDNPDIYYDGTVAEKNGNTVKLTFRWEP